MQRRGGRLLIAAFIFAPVGAVLTALMFYMAHIVIQPDIDVSYDLGAAFILLFGLVAGAVGGFATGMLPAAPKAIATGAFICAWVMLAALYSRRQSLVSQEFIAAVRSGDIVHVEMILSAGANRNARSPDGHTAVQIALRRKDCKMVEYLLSAYGADNPPDMSSHDTERVRDACGGDMAAGRELPSKVRPMWIHSAGGKSR